MDRLAGKVAIVTGGDTGIGAATARLFAAEGAHVLIVGIVEETLIETVKEIGGEAVSYAVADTSRAEDTRFYVAEAVARYGGLDVLVSNAGIPGPVELVGDHSVEDFDQVMAVNVRGVWLSYKYAAPELAKRGGGAVVLTASMAGLVGLPAISSYVASKHAVIGLAKTFALEGAPHGIRVNAVCPGFIDTTLLDAATAKYAPIAGATEEQVSAIFEGRAALKRKGTAQEVARLNLFLVSDDSSFVTGSSHLIDGGVTAGIL